VPTKQSVYIFDVDGVLNNLEIYQPDRRVLGQIAALLDAEVFVAINTGRGYDWVHNNVVQPLQRALRTPESATRLFAAVEMGGLGVEFVHGIERRIPSAFSLSQQQIALVRHIFDQHPGYSNKIHWYEKESMATIDKNSDTTLDAFRPIQKKLTTILQEAFKGQHVKVANSNDAIDVQAPEAGKWAGAQLIYEWLRRATNIQHDHFVCFGDSIVDYEMARFFAEQSHDTVFVCTGPVFFEQSSLHPGVELLKAQSPYNEGTYQYLRAHPTPTSFE